MWPAVQFSLDFLRISVLCQLLPRFVNKEKEAVLLRVPHLELLSTELAHVLGGNVRSHEEGLSRAATVDLLERNSEVILQVEKETWETNQKRKQDRPISQHDNARARSNS